MQTILQDVRYAVRNLLKNGGFAIVVIITMALGIGANTAIFSVVDAVLFRPLPFQSPDRLMSLSEKEEGAQDGGGGVSYPNAFDWRNQSKSFESMATYHQSDVTLTGVDQPQHLTAEVVSSDFFTVFAVQPMLGRGFLPEEEKAGNRAAVLSHKLWQSRFGSDQSIVGRQVTLDGKSFTVVGVMPVSFAFPVEAGETPALWTSIANDAYSDDKDLPAATEQRGMQFLECVGRLKSGVTMVQAKSELDAIARGLAKQYPQSNARSTSVEVKTLREALVGDTRPLLTMLFGAVAFVLMIACANTANLLMARAADRQNEMAVRSALGASQGRLIQQLLTEAILLAVLGGACGLLLARFALDFFRQQSGSLPRIAEVSLDIRVLLFTAAVAVLTGVLFGLIPAWQVARPNVLGVLRSGVRTAVGGMGQSRVRDILVVGETALGLLLLVGSGLLIGSLVHMLREFPGFDAHNVLTVRVEPPAGSKDEQQLQFYKDLLPRLQAQPGVKAAAGVFPLPLSESGMTISFQTEELRLPKGQRPSVAVSTVSPAYFQTMGISLLKGRMISERDDEKAPPVIMVNESFVKKYYPNSDPIGKRMEIGLGSSLYQKGATPWREIVGVIGDVKERKLNITGRPAAYIPYPQGFFGTLTLTIKTVGDPLAAANAIRTTIAGNHHDLPVYSVRTMEDYIARSVAVPKFHTFLLTLFASLALILAAVGLYGVMSYMVIQRTRDIGVRIALGAAPSDITRMVLGKGLVLALIGVGLGTGVALLLARFMRSFLYQVEPLDIATYSAVIALLVGVAVLASYLPARRAASVDPMVALRAE